MNVDEKKVLAFLQEYGSAYTADIADHCLNGAPAKTARALLNRMKGEHKVQNDGRTRFQKGLCWELCSPQNYTA